MVRLRDAGIPVYLIAGNHDAASIILQELTLPENVYVFSTRSAESKEVASHPVVIHGRGFPHRAVPEGPGLSPGHLGQIQHRPFTHQPHGTPRPRHLRAMFGTGPFRDKGYGYWALGHIHQPEVISKDPWIVFAGNCQGRHAREIGPRGCRLVTVTDSLAVESAEWRDLDVVRWNELKVDLTGIDDEARALTRASDMMGTAVAAADGRGSPAGSFSPARPPCTARSTATTSGGIEILAHRTTARRPSGSNGSRSPRRLSMTWLSLPNATRSPESWSKTSTRRALIWRYSRPRSGKCSPCCRRRSGTKN